MLISYNINTLCLETTCIFIVFISQHIYIYNDVYTILYTSIYLDDLLNIPVFNNVNLLT